LSDVIKSTEEPLLELYGLAGRCLGVLSLKRVHLIQRLWGSETVPSAQRCSFRLRYKKFAFTVAC